MEKHHIKKRVTALFVIMWADIYKAVIIFTFSLQMLFCHINLLANTKSVLSITPAGGKPKKIKIKIKY